MDAIHTNLATWQKLLADRGLLNEATKAGWFPNGTGWKYPVYDNNEQQIDGVYRWKAFDSGKRPKYLWEPAEATGRPVYYILPGTREAIDKAQGKVIIASGEPDVLAYRAAGTRNVLCWFGEGQTPETLAGDLTSFGVRRVECYPDCDETGIKWAQTIAQRLNGSGIGVEIYELPGASGSKMDINRLWIDCAFVPDKFWEQIALAPPMNIKVAEPKPLPLVDHKFDDMPDGFYQAIEKALGVAEYKSDGWSKPIKCPMKNHEHDTPGGYAAAWHKEKHILSCLKGCGTDILAKEVGAALSIDWREFVPKPVVPPTPTKTVTPTRPQSSGQPKIIYSFAEAAATVLDELDGKLKESVHEPLPMPFKGIAALGGLAKSIMPGKMIAIVGDSGDGKTSFEETLWESWLKRGFHGVAWGPEWTKEEYVYRAIQRHGGPSVMDIVEHKAWFAAAQRGVSEDKRPGKALTQEQRDKGKQIVNMINAWPGKLVFIERMGISVNELIQKMSEVVAGFAANGKRISFAICDYAQLLRSSGEKTSDRVDRALADFKAFCVDKQLVGVVANQITKADGRAQASGNASTQHVMQNARSDYFNLVLTISREVNADGQRSSTAKVRVAKNSLGTNGEVQLFIKGERLSWHDVEIEHHPLNLPLSKPVSATAKDDFGTPDDDD